MSKPLLYLVDDHPDIGLLLGQILVQEFEVATFEKGLELLAAVDQRQPDVAVLDIGLPDISGWELACELRQRMGSRVLLAAMTGTQPDEQRFAEFDMIFIKPIGFLEVRDSLVREYQSRSSVDEMGGEDTL